ncbi:hypothetical protein [Lactococcus lactis]|uniref:hypothetical protein n=1 Tax=Lactococcus lactis TaxID=1358 RepID=UPI00288DAC5C|nr:hypothetical protein [Lactococcus lactis]MDT2909339.1 hypothetical protein [Lactococcus lactis]MDT2925131.1 hypothetical protein [Lactococcus lactis]MDT2951990.1 hypothetical protein [Lactococcus lactis]
MWTLGLLLGEDGPDGGCGGCLFDIIFWGILIVLGFSLIKIYWALILLIILVIIILKATKMILPAIIVLALGLLVWTKRSAFGKVFIDISNLGWFILAALLLIFAWMIIDAYRKDKKK